MFEQAAIDPTLPSAHTALLQRVSRTLAQTTDSFAFMNAVLSELHTLLQPAFAQVLLLNRDQDEL
ncbi:MAG TPA: hypothetical protein VFO07_20090, partial [Roseiflexaceae bacterium]|nr:hypothetical protein [Roseiflexaceae bacterium]